MSGRGDARSQVHVGPDVALRGQVGRAGVEAHAHPDRARGERRLCRGGRAERPRRGWEDDEEGIALGIDLDAAARAERRPQDAAMLPECLRICLRAELVQQLGRALDVGEQEGDRAVGEIAPHSRHDALEKYESLALRLRYWMDLS
jgi:hypothetical protein